MKLENQYCTAEQSKELHRLGIRATAHKYWMRWDIPEAGNNFDLISKETLDECEENPMVSPEAYPAWSVAELLKALPFIINHESNDYFMSFGHGSKGYRVIYETNKLGLIFNLDDELDREKKALFGTMRSGKYAAEVLAEYLRMLLDSNSNVIIVETLNERLNNA